jgi:hypothetical protein
VRASRRASLSADRDAWTKKAFEACAAAINDLIGVDGLFRSTTPIGRLTEPERGWLVSTVVSTWVRVRSEQAATEGWNYERAAHSVPVDPDPWVVGAIAAILSKLAEACPDAPWASPVGEWKKDDVVAFLLAAFNLIQHALAARDAAENPPALVVLTRTSSRASSTPQPAIRA